jgi:hypothetical protein
MGANMKRTTIILCVLALLGVACYAWARTMVVGVVQGAAAAVSYPDIIFYHSFEASTTFTSCAPDKQVGGSDTTPTANGGGAVIDNTFRAVGTNSLDLPTSSDRMTLTLNNDDLVDVDAGIVGFYVYFDSFGTGSSFGLFSAYYDANNYIRVETFATSTNYNLRMMYKAGGTAVNWNSNNNAIRTGNWDFVEIIWNKAAEGAAAGTAFEMKVNGTSVGTNDGSSGEWTKSATGVLEFGDFEGNTTDCHIDQVIISNDPTRDLNAIKDNTSFPD